MREAGSRAGTRGRSYNLGGLRQSASIRGSRCSAGVAADHTPRMKPIWLRKSITYGRRLSGGLACARASCRPVVSNPQESIIERHAAWARRPAFIDVVTDIDALALLRVSVPDLEGDPLIHGERRRVRQDVAGRNVRVGMRHAIVAVMHGDMVVGLRFQPGEMPVPAVVCKGAGEACAAMLAEARQRGIAVVDNAALAAALAAGHKVGDFIAPDLFEMAAEVLVAGQRG